MIPLWKTLLSGPGLNVIQLIYSISICSDTFTVTLKYEPDNDTSSEKVLLVN